MALIDWSETLSVNIAEIDNQHRMLISMINKLHDAMKQGQGKSMVGEIINELSAYADFHFKTEEKYFDQYQYPGTIDHKKEHAEFTVKVMDFKTGFEHEKLGLSVYVMNFLSDWLQNHIKNSDKKYSPFLNGKGIK